MTSVVWKSNRHSLVSECAFIRKALQNKLPLISECRESESVFRVINLKVTKEFKVLFHKKRVI